MKFCWKNIPVDDEAIIQSQSGCRMNRRCWKQGRKKERIKLNWFPSFNSANSEHSRWTGFLCSERLYNQPYMYNTTWPRRIACFHILVSRRRGERKVFYSSVEREQEKATKKLFEALALIKMFLTQPSKPQSELSSYSTKLAFCGSVLQSLFISLNVCLFVCCLSLSRRLSLSKYLNVSPWKELTTKISTMKKHESRITELSSSPS